MGGYIFLDTIIQLLQWLLGLCALALLAFWRAYARPYSFIGGLLYKYLPAAIKERGRLKAGKTPKRQIMADLVPGQIFTYVGDPYTTLMRGFGTAMVFFGKGGAWQETKKKYFIAAAQTSDGQDAVLLELPKSNMGTPSMFLLVQETTADWLSEAIGALRDEGADAPITKFLEVEEQGKTWGADIPGLGPVTILDGVHMNIRPVVTSGQDSQRFGMMATEGEPEHVYTVFMHMKSGQYALFVSYENGPRQYTCLLYIGAEVNVNLGTFDILPPANADADTLRGI